MESSVGMREKDTHADRETSINGTATESPGILDAKREGERR
ncbi:hypothetical protein Htur_4731 (plasmid) [Haloterrigena turkmenica DSM 5511]|uniref:Uncharacterized protein n=1 Tax=Haloterrigena turkmenica (strain ATCC 51198 / DSM 5511 / JCM 9101 / NCIMB 13204 / VKM B-1734 / 4k) TaxID=543526 RepID=D2S2A8_HALTV|nr:hypothetical protein Htur_4731 [Haloterrigena turkmenica DSM 5511]